MGNHENEEGDDFGRDDTIDKNENITPLMRTLIFWQQHLRQVIGPSLDMKQVMDPWLYQMGFPVVSITSRTNLILEVTQTRFMIDPVYDTTQPPSPYG